MSEFLTHIQSHAMAYAGVAVCCLPLLILCRRQVFPVLWYAAEIALYLAAVHLLLNGVMRLLRWFKVESTFNALTDEKVDPGWKTPLLDFWDRSLYKPGWLFYCEVAAAVVILYCVWRFRPFKIQRLAPQRSTPRKGLPPSARPSMSGVRR